MRITQGTFSYLPDFSDDEVNQIVQNAEEMWSLWTAFFDRLRKVMFGTENPPVGEPAEAMATA